MTDQPCLEVPFDEVEKWEKIQGSCARLYAAANWGYKQALATPLLEPPTDEEIADWHGQCADLTRLREADHYWAFDLRSDEVAGVVGAALARWGRPATPPPEAPTVMEALAARPLLEQVARLGDCIGANTVGEIMAISSRAAAWLEANPPGQPVAIEPRGCPTPGACSCVEPATPPSEPPTDQELEPSFSQRQQLLHGMMRCLCQSSVHDYLKVWIRDYTRAALERWGN